ncbi:hypothetical protein SLEP1_g29660 [Rubroshorea leprosula]|uniref:Uncharacterized protein n=1 Tax=Rubroshorea leprosula TaxID=152421 RepID=A0AAV5K8Y5_9ROSI|nr:hypothetical protein SLEP1_g29660 [Rubroshorea leprosula]
MVFCLFSQELLHQGGFGFTLCSPVLFLDSSSSRSNQYGVIRGRHCDLHVRNRVSLIPALAQGELFTLYLQQEEKEEEPRNGVIDAVGNNPLTRLNSLS